MKHVQEVGFSDRGSMQDEEKCKVDVQFINSEQPTGLIKTRTFEKFLVPVAVEVNTMFKTI